MLKKKIIILITCFCLLFSVGFFSFYSSFLEHRLFVNKVMIYCREDEIEKIIPFLSTDILERNKNRKHEDFIYTLKYEFPTGFEKFKITQIEKYENHYFATIEYNNMIFYLYFEKKLDKYQIYKFDLFNNGNIGNP